MEKRTERENEFLVDIASDRVYQHQSSEYRDAFTKWRNGDENKYGYRFVHDRREHTYVDGGGFADKQAATAEEGALRNCMQFLGKLMILYFLIEQAGRVLFRVMFSREHVSWVYYSLRTLNTVVPSAQVYIYCTIRILSIALPMALFFSASRLPARVALPSYKPDRELVSYGFSVAIMLFVCFRFLDIVLMHTLAQVHIDSTYYTYMQTDTEQAQIFYFCCELVIYPIITELLFRGCLLQLFRQFGDNFAIFISALAGALCYHDLTKIMFVFALGIAIGTITIRNGSLFPAIVIQLFMTNVMLLLNTITADKLMSSRLIEVGVCLFLLTAAFFVMIFMRIHYDNPFRFREDCTELSFKQKMRQLLNSGWAVLWLVIMLLATILSVGFI